MKRNCQQKQRDLKNIHSCYKYSDYPEYSLAKYGLVPTTPNKGLKDGVTTAHKLLKDDIVKYDVVEDKISDKDETIPNSKVGDKDEFDDNINFNEALELCDKLTNDKNDKDENDKA